MESQASAACATGKGCHDAVTAKAGGPSGSCSAQAQLQTVPWQQDEALGWSGAVCAWEVAGMSLAACPAMSWQPSSMAAALATLTAVDCMAGAAAGSDIKA